MNPPPPKKGQMVRYCHQFVEQKLDSKGRLDGPPTPKGDPQDVRAQVVQVHDDGEIDVAVIGEHGDLVCGITRPKRAEVPADRIKPGHWWPGN